MGVVYEAIDTGLNRRVALKLMIPASHPDPEEAAQDEQRFLREGHLAAGLPKHPHMVGVYEAGIIDGKRFLAMEFIDGQSLSDWSEKGKKSLRNGVAVLRDAAMGVHHAHEHGIIHRDLKPANILVDTQNHPHITDFGLAKMVGPKGQVSLTNSGFIVGTPAYISPEQARGLESVDRRTDVYALGVILYEMLAGRPPFEGATAIDILMKAVKNPAPPPSSLMRKAGEAPADQALEKICLKALAKNPPQRYQTARAFAEDLDRWLKGEEVRVTVPSTRRTVVPRRRPAMVLGVSLGVALLGIGAVFYLILETSGKREIEEQAQARLRQEHEERDRAEKNRKAAEERAREAERELKALRAKAIPAIAGKDRQALRPGAIAEYFVGTNFDSLSLRRIDAALSVPPKGPVSWPGVSDYTSLRWSGYLDVPETGAVLARGSCDDGLRLFVDGAGIISDWVPRGSGASSGVCLLEKGLHRFVVEHFQISAAAPLSLIFSSGSGVESGAVVLHDPADFTAVAWKAGPIEPDRSSLPGAQEAETLQVLEVGGGGTFALPFGRGKGCIVWGPKVGPGDRLRLRFTAPESQRRTVILGVSRNRNHGIFQVSINGTVVAEKLDLFDPRGHFVEVEFKNVDLRQGANEIEFFIVGKNPASKEWNPGNGFYKLGLDYLRLR